MTKNISIEDDKEKQLLIKLARQSSENARKNCLASGVSVVAVQGNCIVETNPDGSIKVLKTLEALAEK